VKILIVTGIWPPDVGGPASHAPELADFLSTRGHKLEVVTTAEGEPAPRPYPVFWTRRSLPAGARHLAVAELVRRRARRAEVVYDLSMLTRCALATTLARRPLVVKLPTDPAYERARRRGLFAGDMDEFQRFGGGVQVRALRLARNAALGRARAITCPSAYLRELAIGWGVAPERIRVVPNPAPPVPELEPREKLRKKLGLTGPTLAFAGRLTRQKTLAVALEALAAVDGVDLILAGDGPERARLEQKAGELGLGGRVRLLGSQTREQVLELFRAADASLLSSAWENFPHTVVESLAVGTPVISTAVGGVAEAVREGENGLLVPPGEPEALAAAVRRYLSDGELRGRLQAGAAPSAERFSQERIYSELESVLVGAAGGGR
jgi:glycosyltransferase involved in cell wall biosynthesis